MANRWEKVLLGKKWAYSGGASYAVYDKLPDSKKEFDKSRDEWMKLWDPKNWDPNYWENPSPC